MEVNDLRLPTIQNRILKYFGHIIRRDSVEDKVNGKRKRGRSPVGFNDQIETLTNMTVEGMIRTVEDREAWRKLTYIQ